ncbi:hypothetical protein Zm00014a_017098 [Zea mays]|uniref:Uncharacterized protein n=1 Tax=Zea mays TaxID=4577 RepID=A0A3L6FRF7_MAIZE|nr:hypothetical protein Zm00014a_017098 [Zea mays]
MEFELSKILFYYRLNST